MRLADFIDKWVIDECPQCLYICSIPITDILIPFFQHYLYDSKALSLDSKQSDGFWLAAESNRILSSDRSAVSSYSALQLIITGRVLAEHDTHHSELTSSGVCKKDILSMI